MSLVDELRQRTQKAQDRIAAEERAEKDRQLREIQQRYARRNDSIFGQFERAAKEAADAGENYLEVVKREEYRDNGEGITYELLRQWDRDVCDFIREQGLHYSIQPESGERPEFVRVSIHAHW